MTELRLDVAILGGGVAGLWLLARLHKLGYRAALIESDRLGAGQTRYAQGIIHGGTKYALTGTLSEPAKMVAQMPSRWRACLAGQGELDLRAARLLSPYQYLWSTRDPASRLAGFFASKLMRSRIQALDRTACPPLFRNPAFRGQVYQLDEPVLDVASLVRALAEPRRALILKADAERMDLDADLAGRVSLPGLTLTARKLVLAAGRGNRDLLAKLGRSGPAMQLRPLRMVALRGGLPRTWAHCLGASTTPRVTITSHPDRQGRTVWYVGGQLAEEGVDRTAAEQIAVAKKELAALFPWQDFSACDWITLPVARAEAQAGGSLPDDVYAEERDGVITVWPTKLALAPVVAERIESRLQQAGITPGEGPDPAAVLGDQPHPEYAPLPWQEEERWN
ncbi:MAG TPA: FAD-dependent oxidoreductase [Chromatiales bacterium]|nr:FAD-dependent oxidoreductase [Chromatiales bacterium]